MPFERKTGLKIGSATRYGKSLVSYERETLAPTGANEIQSAEGIRTVVNALGESFGSSGCGFLEADITGSLGANIGTV
jgi:hypothetical protein